MSKSREELKWDLGDGWVRWVYAESKMREIEDKLEELRNNELGT